MTDNNENRRRWTQRLATTKSTRVRCGAFLIGAYWATASMTALAGPEGGEIVGGVGTINLAGPGVTVINQASQNLSIDWQTFNVGENEAVRFDQPSSQAVALNRIFDQNPSQIFEIGRAHV